MTREDLLEYGYIEIGELFFKDTFFCRLTKDGSVDFRYADNDMEFQCTINSIHELGEAEKNYYEKIAKHYKELSDTYAIIAKNYVVPV